MPPRDGAGRRRKGHSFERLICQLVRDIDKTATVRRGKQSHLADEPDVVIESGAGMLPRLWLECHHGQHPINRKLGQARKDAPLGRIPVLILRRTGANTIHAVIEMSELCTLVGARWINAVPVTGNHVMLEARAFLRMLREISPLAKEIATA